ncbi:hypothetical protein TNIN_291881 [Trichonephila inaurata madagascariensis]|uniref:Uncharacterized protein n=1 Tax=Trichonephila inaurata madagascariensis TaxID=2747483 RepID=A0A8X6XID6_9ARAC|nr:hypothetical protein TNIN_291881 [Trichonephila inaurata madagascariensis]
MANTSSVNEEDEIMRISKMMHFTVNVFLLINESITDDSLIPYPCNCQLSFRQISSKTSSPSSVSLRRPHIDRSNSQFRKYFSHMSR